MPGIVTTVLRGTESIVALVVLGLLSDIFRPISPVPKPGLFIGKSRIVSFAFVVTFFALIYSSGYFVIISMLRKRHLRLDIQVKVAIAFAIILLGGTIILADSNQYRYCHQSVNVSCAAMEWSMTMLFILSMVYGVDLVWHLDQLDRNSYEDDFPTPPAKQEGNQFHPAMTPV
ncbi:hypothetical protein THRCLA_02040 [Thraustotheca clavata]|uniref:MARVEL domain-containing protein n=1 Tax=Thraustotheca clavata TaxID=74557 RepID=A0A1W0A6F0_9STRA|nr:hypothetical protein THRCLA_02040 [Thraustotheca clavata]